jgi:hypothetical protein
MEINLMESIYPFAKSDKPGLHVHIFSFSIVLVMSITFAIPAFINGFPFVFDDTGAYLAPGGIHSIPQDWPIYYAVFNRILDINLSPWPGIFAQSLLAAWMLRCFASTFFAITPVSHLLLAFLLTISTSLPWFVGQLMPDIFTSLMILSLGLLLLAADALSRSSGLVVAALISASVAFHQANFLVALWIVPAIVLCLVLGWRPSKLFLNGLIASFVALILGVAALFTINVVAGRWALSSGGSVIYMARLLEDGPAFNYLDTACVKQRFAICALLNGLKSYRPTIVSFPDGRSYDVPLALYFVFGGLSTNLGAFAQKNQKRVRLLRIHSRCTHWR